tara:strand:+ start:219 stop:404 length:186 start_codon:yes stop_codon:yes gene_type:complete
MKKLIRSISLSEDLDMQLKRDSETRGLTVSANLARILFEHFQQAGVQQKRGSLNLLSTSQK